MDTTSGSYFELSRNDGGGGQASSQEMVVQENVRTSSTPKPRAVRQSVIKEWTEEQLLTILVELASTSPKPMLYFEMCKGV